MRELRKNRSLLAGFRNPRVSHRGGALHSWRTFDRAAAAEAWRPGADRVGRRGSFRPPNRWAGLGRKVGAIACVDGSASVMGMAGMQSSGSGLAVTLVVTGTGGSYSGLWRPVSAAGGTVWAVADKGRAGGAVVAGNEVLGPTGPVVAVGGTGADCRSRRLAGFTAGAQPASKPGRGPSACGPGPSGLEVIERGRYGP